MNRKTKRKNNIRKIKAIRAFEVEHKDGTNVKVDIGDVGELLGGKREGIGYTVIINDKTLYIKEKRVLKQLFGL